MALQLFSAKTMKVQHQPLGEVLRTEGHNLGVVLLPTYAYKKGTLYQHEAQAQSQLAKQGLFIDRSIVLRFSERADDRSDRLLINKATLVSQDEDPSHFKMWRTVPAVRDPVVDIGP